MIISDSDITSKINLIASNVPDNLLPLEKIRWVYLKLGQVLCYDYSIMTEDRSAARVTYEDGNFYKVGRYQTCIQISEILRNIINNLNLDCIANLIDRDLPGVNYAQNHQAVEVMMATGEKYLFDLTLDLYLIQSGCQTTEFGFTSDRFGTYDIIPLEDVKEIDQKIGLLSKDGYTGEKNQSIKDRLESIEYPPSPKTKLEIKLKMIARNLVPTFMGAHEGKRYMDKLLYETLANDEISKLKTYNLFFQNINYLLLVTCYVFNYGEENICYLYDNRAGFIQTNPANLKHMMENDWQTNSSSFDDVLYDMNKLRSK